MAQMMYGGGLRLMECVRLRVKDLDFERKLIYVRSGKGAKDRTTLFPDAVHAKMKSHLETVKTVHANDLTEGFGKVYLPGAGP